MEIMIISELFCIAALIMYIVLTSKRKDRQQGTLKLYDDEDAEGPYMFVELAISIRELKESKRITLNVENHIPRK